MDELIRHGVIYKLDYIMAFNATCSVDDIISLVSPSRQFYLLSSRVVYEISGFNEIKKVTQRAYVYVINIRAEI